MISTILLFFFFSINSVENTSAIPEDVKKTIVYKINKVRSKGCNCGGEYFAPAGPLTWNDKLYRSALSHAKDMHRNQFFDHFSSSGKDIGERLDRFGYYWQHAGENLGEGQQNFDEVMEDWIASPTHCQMLMNPNVKEVAVAKYRRFWVQHFGTKIPKGARRKNVTVSRGE